VAVGGLAEDQHVDGQQRVEPAAGLVDRLGDEIRRERELLGRPRRPRVADLGGGHRPRIEPGVDDRLDPACQSELAVDPGLGALGAVEGDLVDIGAVRVDAGDVAPGELGELRQRGDAGEVAVPQRQIGSGVPQ